MRLVSVNVVDNKEGAVACPKSELAVGESMKCTKSSKAKDGQYENIATVEGTFTDESGKKTKRVAKDPSHYYGVEKACLGNRVWFDDNSNGAQDVGEAGVDGVKVTLLDKDGKAVATTKTDSGGMYQFCNLDAGDYSVKFDKTSLPKGYKITKKDATDDSLDSDADINSGVTKKVTLKEGEFNKSLDMGIYLESCLGDYVWYDKDGNGIQDKGEVPVSGVKIALFNKDGSRVTDINGKIVEPTVSGKDGKYNFCHLPKGKYYIEVEETPSTYDAITKTDVYNNSKDRADNDINSFTKRSQVVSIDAGESDLTLDIGVTKSACVGNLVWEDLNANGVQDSGENGISNVYVQVLNADLSLAKNINGEFVKAVKTDANGNYKVCGLLPGEYKLAVVKPDGYYVTPSNIGDDAKDSDLDKYALITDYIKLEGKDIMSLDSGLYRPAEIGDFIWEDLNANGIQDKGEPAIKDVIIELFDKDGNSVVDANGDEVTYQKTNSNGYYKFRNLVPGKYYIKMHKPTGYKLTTKDSKSDDAKDSDFDRAGKSVVTELISNEDDATWDGGLYRPASIGDLVWEDANANGVQDEDEAPVAGVSVALKDKDGNSVLDADGKEVKAFTTDKNGNYKFDNLVPGIYHIEITMPSGYVVTLKDNTDKDAKDSDFGPTFGKSVVTSKNTELISNEDDLTWDAGIFKPAALGYYVWKDTNANGKYDENEKGINGVKVILMDADGNSVKDINGDIVEPIYTDENGNYEFTNLIPGTYKVKIVTTPDENNVPYNSTKQDSADEGSDSDIPANVDSGETETITLRSGDRNHTLGAGFTQEVCLGDYMWYDKNLNGSQDKGEPGVVGIKVSLFSTNGKVAKDVYGNSVKAVKTDKNGKYKFCHLAPGKDYIVKFDVPSTYMPTLVNKGSDLKDSDANSKGEILVKNLTKDNNSYDIGIYCDCDDYTVRTKTTSDNNSTEDSSSRKSMSASALNIIGALFAMLTLALIARREQE